MRQIRYKHLFVLTIALVFIGLITFLHDSIRSVSGPIIQHVNSSPPGPKKPTYKKPSSIEYPLVEENFPLAAAAKSSIELPPIPSWNSPPSSHVPEKTPLFIGFTRNWRVLQQVVVSYITAGWPPEDIYVVENTGVMDSNVRELLSLQNPFFLNHTRLEMLGVNVLITPTLFTFAQLQNFYLYTSIQRKWEHYFWSHMDIIVTSFEDRLSEKGVGPEGGPDPQTEAHKYRSLYENCLHALRQTFSPPEGSPKWAMRFFSYDRLALVNVQSFVEVGGWDTMIPFYTTDCDMHFRLESAGYSIENAPAGMVYDVASSLDDLLVLYRKQVGEGPVNFTVPEPSFKDPNELERELAEIAKSEEELKNAGVGEQPRSLFSSKPAKWKEDDPTPDNKPSPSPLFLQLLHTFDAMQGSKATSARGRNTWQARAKGGIGEPFYRDSEGFEEAIGMTIEHGRKVFGAKWGHRDCDLGEQGLRGGRDEWRVESDWGIGRWIVRFLGVLR